MRTAESETIAKLSVYYIITPSELRHFSKIAFPKLVAPPLNWQPLQSILFSELQSHPNLSRRPRLKYTEDSMIFSFSNHYQGSVDFYTVNIHCTFGMYFLINIHLQHGRLRDFNGKAIESHLQLFSSRLLFTGTVVTFKAFHSSANLRKCGHSDKL